MIAVLVEFEIAKERMSEFMPEIERQAIASFANEADCHQFDICQDPRNANVIILYEIYTSEAAFDDHLATPHFKAFDAAVSDMILSKSVRVLPRIHPVR